MTATYTDEKTGRTWPLEEADTDYSFRVYKAHRRKAVIGDPTSCLIAMGLQRDEDIAAAFIGSGKDAFVVFKGKVVAHRCPPLRHPGCRREGARHLRPEGLSRTQWLTLSAPTPGRTLEARRKLDKRRREEIKDGTRTVTHRDTPNKKRVTRLGVANRPKPIVSRGGEWTVPELHPDQG